MPTAILQGGGPIPTYVRHGAARLSSVEWVVACMRCGGPHSGPLLLPVLLVPSRRHKKASASTGALFRYAPRGAALLPLTATPMSDPPNGFGGNVTRIE